VSLARQDTIDEGGEGDTAPNRDRQVALIEREQRPSLERQPTERDRLLDPASKERERERERQLERNLSMERERQIEMASSRNTTSDTYDTGLREQPSTLAQRDLIATVLDMKVDVRLEMQRMSQRITRIEELLGELVRKLSNESSGQSTPGDVGAIPVIPTTTSITVATTTTSSSVDNTLTETGSGGNGLGPLLLRKRRQKSKKAPAPPAKQSPEQTRLLEAELPSTSSRKREFL
jgi:potassium voltage-gated channel Eag-related subfamily H member 5